jgi:hypothetical protein
MCEPFAVNDRFGEPEVQLVIIMEVSEIFAPVAKRREAVLSTRPRAMFNAQLFQSSDQLCSQISHLLQPSAVTGTRGLDAGSHSHSDCCRAVYLGTDG